MVRVQFAHEWILPRLIVATFCCFSVIFAQQQSSQQFNQPFYGYLGGEFGKNAWKGNRNENGQQQLKGLGSELKDVAQVAGHNLKQAATKTGALMKKALPSQNGNPQQQQQRTHDNYSTQSAGGPSSAGGSGSSSAGRSNSVNADNGKIAEAMGLPLKKAKSDGQHGQAVAAPIAPVQTHEVRQRTKNVKESAPWGGEKYEKLKNFGNGAKEIAHSAGHNVKEAASRAGSLLKGTFAHASDGRQARQEVSGTNVDQHPAQPLKGEQQNDQRPSGKNEDEPRTESKADLTEGRQTDREGISERNEEEARRTSSNSEQQTDQSRMGYESRKQSAERNRMGEQSNNGHQNENGQRFKAQHDQGEEEEEIGRDVFGGTKRRTSSNRYYDTVADDDGGGYSDNGGNGWKSAREGMMRKANKFGSKVAKIGRAAAHKASHVYHNVKESERTASLKHRAAKDAIRVGSKIGQLSRDASRKTSSVLHKNGGLKNGLKKGAHLTWEKAKHAYSRANSYMGEKGTRPHHSPSAQSAANDEAANEKDGDDEDSDEADEEIRRRRLPSVPKRRHSSMRRKPNQNGRGANANGKAKVRENGGGNNRAKQKKQQQRRTVYMDGESGGRNKRTKERNNGVSPKRSRSSPTTARQHPRDYNPRIIYASSEFPLYKGAYVDDVAFNFRR